MTLDQVPGLPEPEKSVVDLLRDMPEGRSLRLPRSKYDFTNAQISGYRGVAARYFGRKILHTVDTEAHYFTVVVRVDSNTTHTAAKKSAKVAKKKSRAVDSSNFPVLTKLPKRYDELITEMIATSGGVRIRKKAFVNPGARGQYVCAKKKDGYKIEGSTSPSSKYLIVSGKPGAIKHTFRKTYRTPTARRTDALVPPTPAPVLPPAPEAQTTQPTPELAAANA